MTHKTEGKGKSIDKDTIESGTLKLLKQALRDKNKELEMLSARSRLQRYEAEELKKQMHEDR